MKMGEVLFDLFKENSAKRNVSLFYFFWEVFSVIIFIYFCYLLFIIYLFFYLLR